MATARNPIVYALVFLLSFVLVSCKEAEEVAIGAVHAGPGEKVFNVKDYYVPLTKDDDCPGCPEGDEVQSDYTMAFAKAWHAACEHHGKAKVLIPKEDFLIGQLSFTGPCNGSSPATPKIVEILGNVKGSKNMVRYSIPDYWFSFEGIDGLQVIGRGTFDGQGEDELWNCHATRKRDSCTFLPANMLFKEVTNAAVRRITSKNSKGMHVTIENCHNITLAKLDISGPKDKPDTNGVHIFNSTGIRVSKSQISSGDECITIAQNCTNVSINKVTCGPSHGIGVTSVKEYVFPFDPKANRDVRGILVRNSTLTDTENGIRIRIPPGKFKFQASGLVFKDIIMNNVKNPIVIDQGNCSTINSNQTQCDVKISNVHYRNIVGTSASPVALNLTCNKHSPCQNIYLSNVDFKYKGSPLPSICAHAQVGYDGIHPPPCKH